MLLFGFNDRQKEAFMTSANSFSGTLLEWSSGVDQFFSLKKENARLVQENTMLRDMLYELSDSQYVDQQRTLSSVDIVAARVVDNTIRKDDNYVTINKGSRDGLSPPRRCAFLCLQAFFCQELTLCSRHRESRSCFANSRNCRSGGFTGSR